MVKYRVSHPVMMLLILIIVMMLLGYRPQDSTRKGKYRVSHPDDAFAMCLMFDMLSVMFTAQPTCAHCQIIQVTPVFTKIGQWGVDMLKVKRLAGESTKTRERGRTVCQSVTTL